MNNQTKRDIANGVYIFSWVAMLVAVVLASIGDKGSVLYHTSILIVLIAVPTAIVASWYVYIKNPKGIS